MTCINDGILRTYLDGQLAGVELAGVTEHLISCADCRAWFTRQAGSLGLTVEQDRNGNLWAWWGSRDAARQDAVVTGSHLDSVPDGGGYDGALGVVAALAAVEELKTKNFNPERAVAIAVFTEEEGARFRVDCLGSRLITGVIDPASARALRASV